MGKLINGKWESKSIVTSGQKGNYERLVRGFREFISDSHPVFKPDSNRYHLYVSLACPWAHRTLIVRELKQLQSHVSVSVVHPDMLENGWVFDTSFEEATEDSVNYKRYLYEVYQLADPSVTTSVTVPILWDKQTQTIVNNESSEIIRQFNTSFNELTGHTLDLYPESLQNEIEKWNDYIYEPINNGVYKSGFAKTQSAYEEAVITLFNHLDGIEAHLENRSYLVGDKLTEADIRLVTTLIRFDPVYVTHFKCNMRRLVDYPNISRYLSSLMQIEAVKDTTNLAHIKRHYYYSHDFINPFRIIPVGPV